MESLIVISDEEYQTSEKICTTSHQTSNSSHDSESTSPEDITSGRYFNSVDIHSEGIVYKPFAMQMTSLSNKNPVKTTRIVADEIDKEVVYSSSVDSFQSDQCSSWDSVLKGNYVITDSKTNDDSRKTQIYDLTLDEPGADSLYLALPPSKSSKSSSSDRPHPVYRGSTDINYVEVRGVGGIQMSNSAIDELVADSLVSGPSLETSFGRCDPVSLSRTTSTHSILKSKLIGKHLKYASPQPRISDGQQNMSNTTVPVSPEANRDMERNMPYDLTSDELEPESLDFQALKDLMKRSDIPPLVQTNPRNRGPICCNSWCSLHAEIIPTENVRNYFGIPRGNSYRICQKCKHLYDCFSEAAMKHFTNGGDMIELQCAYKNDFVVLEDEQDSDDDLHQSDKHQDLEVENLLCDAIAESVSAFENTTKEAIDRSKKQVLSSLENFIQAGELLVNRIRKVDGEIFENLSTFNKQFERRVINLPELDIPLPDTQMEIVCVEGDSDDSCSASMNQCMELFDSKLPVEAPKVMDTVYCISKPDTSEWSQFKVVEIDMNSIDDKSSETFLLEASVGGGVLRKVVRSDEIAFCHPPRFQVGVGRRVIAGYNNSGIENITKRFLSGMVSELPSKMNRYRYLVFFDDSKVQYCPHSDVRVVYRIYKPVYKYFMGDQSTMAMEYMCNFPQRKLYFVEVGQRIRVEKNGFWVYCRVERVDASLVLVTYLHNSESEWLFRGSPRLRPIFDSAKSCKVDSVSKSHRQRSKNLGKSGKGHSSFEGQLIDISNEDDDYLDDESPLACQSTLAIQESALPRPDKQRTRAAEKKNINVITRFPPNMLLPRSFRMHSCSFACAHWVRYDPIKTQGVGPLAIPSIFAFRRTTSAYSVNYIAPCGVELSNMQEVLEYLSTTLIPLTLDMFSFSSAINIFYEWIPYPQHVVMEDISLGSENVPIPCINEIDSECPTLMSYITERRPHDGVFINHDPGFLISCDCEDNCANRSLCSCWKLNYECFSALNKEGIPLTEIGYQYQRLEESIPSGIYECNKNCKCRSTCINRVVQHPLKNKLQIFKTPKKGWGVRCINDVPKGTFICTYLATVYTEEIANEIGKVRGDEYLAELDHIEVMENIKADYESNVDSDDDSSSHKKAINIKKKSSFPKKCNKSAEVGDTETPDSLRTFYGTNEGPYILDAKEAGNIGRFFNHSCSPNMFVQNVLIDSHDLRFPWVAYFASKDIQAGSELTWNYGYSPNSVPGKLLFCECGSPNCVVRLL